MSSTGIPACVRLTSEQERRIQSLVGSRLYSSPEDVPDAALAAVEQQATPDLEGSQEEQEALLREGLNSGEPVEADDAFWNRLMVETDRMVAEHRAR
ncbi:conserved hypothetical protein [Candidatus Sulfopaludibacter sp. SbA4]|nr:conserved hypothetical protein [Candidatus Sulfopaludibacter sp. SbA4]